MKMLRIQKKNNFLLLEVLLCFTLMVLCFFPLLHPLISVRKTKMEDITLLELARVADLTFVQLKSEFYEGKIFCWKNFDEEFSKDFPVEIKIGAGKQDQYFSGSYTVSFVKKAKKQNGAISCRLLNIAFVFTRLNKEAPPIIFNYFLLIEGRAA